MAAVDDEVSTNVLRLGSDAAACRARSVISTTAGMTLLGSGLRDTSEATCTKESTPVCDFHVLND